MGPIEVDCPNFEPLAVVGDRLHGGHEFVLRSNGGRDALDYLIFLDSRGISRGLTVLSPISWLRTYQEWGRYLLICRPLELTTWATFVNFISLNDLNPAKIVTNMGFVDFTPKKKSILDAIRQVDFLIGKGVAKAHYTESHISSTGEEIALYSMTYESAYRKYIEAISVRQPTVVINTPLVDPEIRIERDRLRAFFSGLREANEFNRSVRGAQVVDMQDFDETLTYDAVHYTSRGNDVIFGEIKGYL